MGKRDTCWAPGLERNVPVRSVHTYVLSQAYLSLPWAEAKGEPSPPSMAWPREHGLPLFLSGSPTTS